MSRLIGAAPGYVGFEEGGKISEAFFVVSHSNTNLGQLTEAVRRKPYGTPFSNHHATCYLIVICFHSAVVLLDELEKAHKVTNFTPFKNNYVSCFGLGCCHDTSSNTR
jgi:hypothetical protein